jgi:glycosyltransferase involved in cell wall biosynthesis
MAAPAVVSRPLTIVQLLPSLAGGGGVERGTLEIACALTAACHRAVVIAADGPLAAQLADCGAEHLDWPVGEKSPRTLALIPRLRRLFHERRPDIVHARSRLPAWLAWRALQGLPGTDRPPFVTTVHGLYSVNRYSAIMTRGARVIAVSRSVRDYLLAHYPHLDPARIVVIPRGVDASEFPHGHRPAPDWHEGWLREFPETRGRVILTLPGRVARRKGQEDFIALIARLAAREINVHGLVVGNLEASHRYYAQGLRVLARSMGVEGRVSFTGQRGDLRDIYASSALILSLSVKPEAFGRTVLEALALGVPVVGYAHGGVGELLDELFPAGRVPPGDTDALEAVALAALRTRHDIAALQGYGLAEMQQQTLALYESLAGMDKVSALRYTEAAHKAPDRRRTR